jgi:hypothetical protein
MSDPSNTVQALGKIEELEAQIASCNEKMLVENIEFPKPSYHYPALRDAVVELSREYRKQNKFEEEMRLYSSQQKIITKEFDRFEYLEWEMYKGGCCLHYKKDADALQHLELAFQQAEREMKDFVSSILLSMALD